MMKLIVLVALVAATHGEDFTESKVKSRGKTSGDACGACAEVKTGYDLKTSRHAYDVAATNAGGLDFYNQEETRPGETLIVSSAPLMLFNYNLMLYTKGETQSHLFKFGNVKSCEEARFVAPKIADEVFSEKDHGFSSKLSINVVAPAGKKFSDSYKKCLKDMIHGEVQEPEKFVGELNEGLESPLVNAEAIKSENGVIVSSSHKIELTFRDFMWTKKEGTGNKAGSPPVWVAEGNAKVYHNEKLDAKIIVIPMQGDRYVTLAEPKDISDLLQKTRDFDSIISMNASAIDVEYIKLTLPFYESICATEDYVDSFKKDNPIFNSKFNDFHGILETGSGYISHMYHKMCIKINDISGSDTAKKMKRPAKPQKEVIVKSDYMYVIRNKSGSPLMRGIIRV